MVRGMVQKWTSGYAVRWTPIVTFTRRRLLLLDWFEAHTEPVQFYEDPDRVGVALVDPGLRMTIDRGGLRLSANSGDLDLASMQSAVQGALDVLEPKDAILQTSSSAWTVPLPDTDYHETRALAACRMAGVGGVLAGGFRAIDGSALIDFESVEELVQLEWGIVEGPELVERLEDPDLGRLGGALRPTHGRRWPDTIPDVALLADVLISRRVGGQVSTAQDLMVGIQLADETARTIATSVFEGQWRGKATDEFAQIG